MSTEEQAQALQNCIEQAAAGNADAQAQLGAAYAAGNVPALGKDEAKALDLFVKAAAQGFLMFWYVNILYIDLGWVSTSTVTCNALKMCIGQGYAELSLAYAYSAGMWGLTPNLHWVLVK